MQIWDVMHNHKANLLVVNRLRLLRPGADAVDRNSKHQAWMYDNPFLAFVE